MDTLADEAPPERIAHAASSLGCRSVALTYNDPVIFLEYALDTAEACHAEGIRTVAVTAGYVCDAPRRDFSPESTPPTSTSRPSTPISIARFAVPGSSPSSRPCATSTTRRTSGSR
jgi:hypothetical protein